MLQQEAKLAAQKFKGEMVNPLLCYKEGVALAASCWGKIVKSIVTFGHQIYCNEYDQENGVTLKEVRKDKRQYSKYRIQVRKMFYKLKR